MALQGTLETFSVPEVLRLLSGTGKTGLLALDGDRGAGKVWLADGRIVEARSDHEQGERVEAVLFDLLRFRTGSFVFDSDARPAEQRHDVDVDGVLVQAEQMLEEWRGIEAVVPSLDVRVHMVDELSGDSVVVSAEQWRSLALVGSGISARRLGAHRDLGEFDACSLVRDLVEAGLVTVTEEDVALVPEAAPAPEPGSAVPEAVGSGAHERTPDAEMSETEIPETMPEAPADESPASFEVAPPLEEPQSVGAPDPVETFAVETSAPESDDFLSQLSNFSPRAAAALEATADDPGSEGPVPEAPTDVPAAEVPDTDVPGTDVPAGEDDDVNRNLLLKFLSSAKN